MHECVLIYYLPGEPSPFHLVTWGTMRVCIVAWPVIIVAAAFATIAVVTLPPQPHNSHTLCCLCRHTSSTPLRLAPSPPFLSPSHLFSPGLDLDRTSLKSQVTLRTLHSSLHDCNHFAAAHFANSHLLLLQLLRLLHQPRRSSLPYSYHRLDIHFSSFWPLLCLVPGCFF
jgi:hypothetical protein